MKFKSRKDAFFRIITIGSVVLFSAFPILGLTFGWIEKADLWVAIPFAAIAVLFLWIYFGTQYILTDVELIYRSGPLRGKIKINQIREIVTGKTMYAGMKPATAAKGLIIRFGKYNEIYISPDSNESFVSEILERNPMITVSKGNGFK